MILAQLAAEAPTVLAGVVDPGTGEAPPGSEGFLTIIRWGAWLAFGICVLGVIVAGAMMPSPRAAGRARNTAHA